MSHEYVPPSRTAHGLVYWLIIGWWWEPTKFIGRIMLWLFCWPLGLWRSIRHGQSRQEAKYRRGYNKAHRRR